ncbi:unnamed protein product, partial [Amoebophrya sp. A120]
MAFQHENHVEGQHRNEVPRSGGAASGFTNLSDDRPNINYFSATPTQNNFAGDELVENFASTPQLQEDHNFTSGASMMVKNDNIMNKQSMISTPQVMQQNGQLPVSKNTNTTNNSTAAWSQALQLQLQNGQCPHCKNLTARFFPNYNYFSTTNSLSG